MVAWLRHEEVGEREGVFDLVDKEAHFATLHVRARCCGDQMTVSEALRRIVAVKLFHEARGALYTT